MKNFKTIRDRLVAKERQVWETIKDIDDEQKKALEKISVITDPIFFQWAFAYITGIDEWEDNEDWWDLTNLVDAMQENKLTDFLQD